MLNAKSTKSCPFVCVMKIQWCFQNVNECKIISGRTNQIKTIKSSTGILGLTNKIVMHKFLSFFCTILKYSAFKKFPLAMFTVRWDLGWKKKNFRSFRWLLKYRKPKLFSIYFYKISTQLIFKVFRTMSVTKPMRKHEQGIFSTFRP